MIGKTLGHYQITNQLGKGGMGEVYQAKDQKLGRDVAIKVLPEEFAKDADRVARFQREAKLLASLNHPNIAAIYGLEESGGTNLLVLELVEGQTLADRIKAGPIPVEESLKLALQIAEALEAAHEKGVIHRDLKPANIKVTPDGKVKVLDFGLAKAYAGEQAELNLSNSPTLSNAATQQGVILGTAAYMSPEQARGKAVDKRADIWAFGCVLFEMMTGRAAFPGKDVTDILAAVIRSEPEWDSLPANMNWRVREVIERCLNKDPKDRYHDISDVRVDIQKILTHANGTVVQPVPPAGFQKKLRMIVPWVAASVLLTAIFVGFAARFFHPIPPQPITRFAVDLAGPLSEFDSIALSPDGRRIVYSTNDRLYLQSLDQLQPTAMAGTEGGSNPFFSPDGQSVAFFTLTQLKKVGVTGGIPEVLAAVTASAGSGLVGSWDNQGRIFFGKSGPYPIYEVPATGGSPKIFAELGDQNDFDYPDVLPGGKWVLFSDLPPKTSRWSDASIVAQSVTTGERKTIMKGAHYARYAPTGHLVYAAGGSLFAIGFDADRLEVIGNAVPLVQNIVTSEMSGHANFAFAANGTLVYKPSTTAHNQRTLAWVDRKGKEQPLAAQAGDYLEPHISPDGTKVALDINTSNNKTDIWIWDFARETMTRLTFNEASGSPLWTLDGKRVAFIIGSGLSSSGVFWKAAHGTGGDEKLGSVPDRWVAPWSWSGDEKTLVTFEYCGDTGFDIGSLSMEGDHKWRPLLKEKYLELQPKISPDGRWMAYASNESGKDEIYVRPFPEVNKGKWQVSTSGGDTPLWSRSGRELFYRNGDSVLAVAVEIGQIFKCGKPETLFRGTYTSWSLVDEHTWDISPDGKRFLMMKPVGSNASASEVPHKLNIVLNWFEELKQRVPVK